MAASSSLLRRSSDASGANNVEPASHATSSSSATPWRNLRGRGRFLMDPQTDT
eukprot:CAMPEP_0196137748 /NCGR_PEP_ID=MMETSP0910-20130528/5637_1 /TAXON_ID=49265 /ORGANISM="Thalassiosira rotula, Strain GSO102" /LENGTH=52 /DNA_ID=CAMNT_0041398253 /DNA_START=93 /DNA_END=251 /DNA_ORIENTATION=+